MRFTVREGQDVTINRLKLALKRRQPVTIGYLKPGADNLCLRTIEPYEITETKDGNTIIKTMDRDSCERRTFRLDRVKEYTVHTGARYQLPTPLNEVDPNEPTDTWVITGRDRVEMARIVASTGEECYQLAMRRPALRELARREGGIIVRRLRYRDLLI